MRLDVTRYSCNTSSLVSVTEQDDPGVDDAAVIWLNGVEVQRVNLTTEEVTTDTWAQVAIAEPNESAVLDYRLDVGDLVDGDNVLAVEVHQAAATSSDLTFDAGLLATRM